MRVVFMGSAPLSCPSLEALAGADGIEVVAAITQPDRPKGRRLSVSESPVKALASSLGIAVQTPENVNAAPSVAAIAGPAPDVIAVAAYGQILKPCVLDLPRLGCVNVHASLLPRYRGAAPIQWAIANGEGITGVTIMFMAEGMDTGDIITQAEVEIGDTETGGELHDRLGTVGARTLVEALQLFQAGDVPRRAQDAAEATYAPKLKKSDGEIDWTSPARDVYNRVRAFNPWPCCRCRIKGHNLRVLAVRVEDGDGEPGTVLEVSGDGPVVAAGEGSVRLVEVQPEGKRPMGGAAYLSGHGLEVGEVLDST
ncbi:methionyl-tRNA formyltransferase [Verrucomicrobiota bacterium]